MKLIAHQAIYGEMNGAHSLIVKSSEAKSPFVELTVRTDRPPGLLPPNLQWHPFISGFPMGDHYILSKTFPDETASRLGMVMTHVLVFELNELVLLNDLTPVLGLLPIIAEKKLDLGLVEFDVPEETVQIMEPPGLGNVIRLLLDEHNGEKPVVWIGQDGFDGIITSLWRGLWPGARANLRFRLSFTPQDTEGQELTIVATPLEMENRWSSYPLAHSFEVHEPQTKAEAFLMGRDEGAPLRSLLTDLEAETQMIRELRKVQASSDYLDSLRDGSISVNGARMLVRLLGNLSKRPTQGAEVKGLALQKLLMLTATGTVADVQAMQNLDIAPFKSGARGVKDTITQWFGQYALTKNKQLAGQTGELIEKSFASGPSLWSSTIQDSVRSLLGTWSPEVASAIWLWWQRSPSLIATLDDAIPNSREVEADLAEQCPSTLPKEMGEAARVFAHRRRWLVLHAAIVGAYSDPFEAFHTQLEVDTDPSYSDGVRVVAERVPAKALISAALHNADPRLFQLAGEACSEHAMLLADFDPQNEAWRQIWLSSILDKSQPWAGITNPRDVMDRLIDLVIDGPGIDPELLERLSSTEYADLSLHPRREEAWSNLEQRSRENYISATVDGWIRQFRADPTFGQVVEPELEDAIVNPSYLAGYFAKAGMGSIPLMINLFRRFSRLTAHQFDEVIQSILLSSPSINAFDAILIGKFVMEKRWHGSAAILSRWVLDRTRPDLIPALQECHALLGWVDSFHLLLSGKLRTIQITGDTWWAALRETAGELYQYGPEHVWERAGGEPGAINRNQSGQAQWDEAIRLLSKGGGGKNITPSDLLAVMRHEYTNNHKLQLLQNWYEQHKGT